MHLPPSPPAAITASRPPPLGARRRRRLWPWLALLAVASGAVAGGLTLWGPAPPPPPRTFAVAMGSVQRTATALGSLQPKEYVDVGSQVSGQLKAIHVEIGDKVDAGAPLAELDPVVYDTKVRADRASLADLDAQIAQARAELTLARLRNKRNETLAKSGTVSEDTLDASRAETAIAEAKVQSLIAQRDKAQSNLDGNIANLGYTRITAPMGGTVVDLSARVGQTLNAVQTTPVILRLANLSTMTVEAQVAESDVNRVRPGTPVYFTTLGQPERKWVSTVRQVLPTPETVNDVVLYTALIDIANDDGALLPDMSAQVFFVLEEAKEVPVVPLSALKAGKDGKRVATVMGANGPEPREVTVGVSNRSDAAVLSGLAPGEMVILPPPAKSTSSTTFQGPPGPMGMGGPPP